MNPTPMLSAGAIADALEQPRPTEQQRQVIEAEPTPLLVVAGAGSGKTETMAGRVVWLVANGFVAPDQVLGLTFTRKAASELAERISRRLARLERSGLWTPAQDDGTGAETLGGTPTVSTYHAYAGRLVREHALRLGYEAESRLLSEAAAWQYAAEVVAAYDGPMDQVPAAESTIIAHVVDLAGEMAEHLLTPTEVRDYLAEVDAGLAGLPVGASRAKDLPKVAKETRDHLRARAGVLPMVERYLELKKQRDAMDFSDQMALAARLASTFPDVGGIERLRFRAILLDEFQDTSDAQLQLLAAVFAAEEDPLPVTAVGDPNQSIYGWRGASATTLHAFRGAFGRGGEQTPQRPLSVSWRNDRDVLQVANVVAAPLRADSLVEVEQLSARPGAGPGEVRAARVETAEEEAALLADWLIEQRQQVSGAGGTSAPRTCAVLCRKRSQFSAVMDALESREIPYEVVGLGGLLLTPEVEDIVALLHVASDPSRGDQLMRLLTGPVCHLGAADLDGLMAWAREQQRRERGDRGADGAPRDLAQDTVDRASVVEALDDLPGPGWEGPEGEGLGVVALDRLDGLRQVLRRMRAMSGLPLADLVGEAERALGLDIEVLARPGYTPAAARAHLDAFADVAASFTASADRPTLGGFLGWLAAALKEERGLDKGYIEASPDAVQVLTIHAAKGLEWDAVAVPGLIEGSFPNLSSATTRVKDGQWGLSEPKDRGWTAGFRDGGVPYDLRGDRRGLPRLDWRSATDWKDIEARIEEFHQAGGEHGVAEERRLAYVAFTRARHCMLLTTPVWADASTPRVTSRFLDEVVAQVPDAVRILHWAPLPQVEPKPVNPRNLDPQPVVWPGDPLADRRANLTRGAELVRQAIHATSASSEDGATDQAYAGPAASSTSSLPEDLSQPAPPLPGQAATIAEELEILLRERAERRRPGAVTVEVPRHLSTSAVVSLARDPEAFATDLRRPMPQAPALAARRGTAFHAWIEQHYSRAAMVDLLELPGSADEDPADDAELPSMKERFLASEWAARAPIEIEIAIETIIDGIAVRGRVDAVFADDRSSEAKAAGVVVVDWKTGRPPRGEVARVRSLQLAAYRLAYARLRGLSPDRVRAAFYYAATGETVWPDLVDEDGLAAVLAAVPEVDTER